MNRAYAHDFITLIDDGRGPEAPLRLRVEIKGIHGEDAWYPSDTLDKRQTVESYWRPGVNLLGAYGRWAFLELQYPLPCARVSRII